MKGRWSCATGGVVLADLPLIDISNLKLHESILTGESVPVEKMVDAIEGAFRTYSLSLGDWMVATLAAVTIFPVLGLAKALMRAKI